MKMATALIFSIVWMLVSFMIGFILIAQISANATANASGALIGNAATQWTNFISYMWVAVSILAMFPLVMVGLAFLGLFGSMGGGGRGGI
jgi:hypothetical protein